MSEQATIVDFIGASLAGMEKDGRCIFSPAEQKVADDIAVLLDRELEQMVSELERVASCQQEDDTVGAEEPLPPFEAFCVGLGRIGDSLLPHLFSVYKDYLALRGLPNLPFGWIVRARADAFVAYLLQIAQVHGLAFDEKLTHMSKAEQIALASLGARLRTIMQQQIDML